MSCPYTKSEIPGYLKTAVTCINGGESSQCQNLNATLVECNSEIQTIIDGLNKQVIEMNLENDALKAGMMSSYNKNNVSGQLFMSYKQHYSVFYVRNCVMLVGIGFVLAGTFQALMNTVEGDEIKAIVSKNIAPK